MAKNIEREYQIKLNAQKKAQAEFEGWSVNRLMNEIIKVRKRNAELESKINALIEKTESKPNNPKVNYNQKWTYPQKISFLVLTHQGPMTAIQIYDALLEADKHFVDFRDPVSILNSYLSRMLKSRRLKAHKLPGIRKNFYILPEWLDANNKLKNEYASQLNFLS